MSVGELIRELERIKTK